MSQRGSGNNTPQMQRSPFPKQHTTMKLDACLEKSEN